jgi:hypothetical protein
MRTILLKYPGLLINVLFLAYFAILGPGVFARLLKVIERGARDPLLAVAFLAAPFLELAGLTLVAPSLIDRLAQAPRRPNTLPVVVWQAHMVLSVVLLLNGFACLQFDTSHGPPLLGIVILAATIIKEIAYLLYWIDQSDVKHRANRRRLPVTPARQLLASLLVMPFTALGFTGMWDLLIARNPIHWSSPGDAVIELALAIFTFLLLFAASRSIFLIEEWAFMRGRGPLLVWAGTLLLSLLLALSGLPRG